VEKLWLVKEIKEEGSKRKENPLGPEIMKRKIPIWHKFPFLPRG
jgi:hypothetical protein